MTSEGKDFDKIRESLLAGKSIRQSMMAGGYAETTADLGRAGMSNELKAFLMETLGEKFRDLVEFGKTVKIEDLRHATIGGLAKNLGERTDKGVNTMKLAGSLRELDMYRPESATGIIVLGEMPKQLEQLTQSLPELPEPK